MNNKKRRNCVTVINEMLEKIPETEYEFSAALKIARKDASYKAPEQTIQWIVTSNILIEYIGVPKKDWEFEVLSIWSTKTVNELKEHYE